MSVQPTDNQYSTYVVNDTLTRAADAVEDAPPVEPLIETAAASAVPAIGVADEADTTPEDLAQVTIEARARSREAQEEQARRIAVQRQRDAARRAAEAAAAVSSAVSAAAVSELASVGQVDASTAATSTTATDTASTAATTTAQRTLADPNDAQAFLRTTSSPAVQELLSTFQNYDNSRAVTRFDNYLTAFTRYTSTTDAINEQTAEANLRAAENAYYQHGTSIFQTLIATRFYRTV